MFRFENQKQMGIRFSPKNNSDDLVQRESFKVFKSETIRFERKNGWDGA